MSFESYMKYRRILNNKLTKLSFCFCTEKNVNDSRGRANLRIDINYK